MITVDLYSKGQFWHKIWCARASFLFCIKSRPLHRAKPNIYLKSTHTEKHFGYHFRHRNVLFNRVHPVLPGVYTSVVGLHIVSLLISLVIKVLVLPQFCINFWGVDAYIYICDSSLGVHRYTRWTGRLSHQTSDLSCPCNLPPEGCDPCFAQYQVQGEEGYCQTTKVTLTEGSPERSGYMHMDKQVTHLFLGMLFSMRGTKPAEVEGLWLVNRLKPLVPEDPDDNPKVQLCSPFIVPSPNSMRDPHEMMS